MKDVLDLAFLEDSGIAGFSWIMRKIPVRNIALNIIQTGLIYSVNIIDEHYIFAFVLRECAFQSIWDANRRPLRNRGDIIRKCRCTIAIH